MNAHKFVAEKGIDEAKRVLSVAPKKSNWFQEKGKYSNDLFSCNHEIYGEAVMLSELKQVVESFGIVKNQGGYDELKQKINEGDVDWKNIPKFRKAIEDYEHVQAYKNGDA